MLIVSKHFCFFLSGSHCYILCKDLSLPWLSPVFFFFLEGVFFFNLDELCLMGALGFGVFYFYYF